MKLQFFNKTTPALDSVGDAQNPLKVKEVFLDLVTGSPFKIELIDENTLISNQTITNFLSNCSDYIQISNDTLHYAWKLLIEFCNANASKGYIDYTVGLYGVENGTMSDNTSACVNGTMMQSCNQQAEEFNHFYKYILAIGIPVLVVIVGLVSAYHIKKSDDNEDSSNEESALLVNGL